MGPKKAKGKAIVITGQYPIEEMTDAELRDYIIKIHEEVTRTRESTELVCKEKDSLETTWSDSKRELKLEKRLLVAKKAELEELEVKFDKLLFEEDQKLEYMQQEDAQTLLKNTVVSHAELLKKEEHQSTNVRLAIMRESRKVEEIQKLETAYDTLMHRMRQWRRDDIDNLIQYNENKLNQTRWKYERLFRNLWDSINADRLALLRAAEKGRNEKIKVVDDTLMKQMQEIRDYFSRITFDCIALISDLKEELESLKETEKEEMKLLRNAVIENQDLTHLHKDTEAAKVFLEQYSKSKKNFLKARTHMLQLKETLKQLELEKYMISSKLENEKDQIEALNVQFFNRVRKLQQSVSLKVVFLEKKLSSMLRMLESPSTDGTPTSTEAEISAPGFEEANLPSSSFSNAYPISVVNLRFCDDRVLFVPPRAD